MKTIFKIIKRTFKRLTIGMQAKTPVIGVVYILSICATLYFIYIYIFFYFDYTYFQIMLTLWFFVIFSNFIEACYEITKKEKDEKNKEISENSKDFII